MKHRWTATLLLVMTLSLDGCAPGDEDGASVEATQPQQGEEPAGNPDDGY